MKRSLSLLILGCVFLFPAVGFSQTPVKIDPGAITAFPGVSEDLPVHAVPGGADQPPIFVIPGGADQPPQFGLDNIPVEIAVVLTNDVYLNKTTHKNPVKSVREMFAEIRTINFPKIAEKSPEAEYVKNIMKNRSFMLIKPCLNKTDQEFLDKRLKNLKHIGSEYLVKGLMRIISPRIPGVAQPQIAILTRIDKNP